MVLSARLGRPVRSTLRKLPRCARTLAQSEFTLLHERVTPR